TDSEHPPMYVPQPQGQTQKLPSARQGTTILLLLARPLTKLAPHTRVQVAPQRRELDLERPCQSIHGEVRRRTVFLVPPLPSSLSPRCEASRRPCLAVQVHEGATSVEPHPSLGRLLRPPTIFALRQRSPRAREGPTPPQGQTRWLPRLEYRSKPQSSE